MAITLARSGFAGTGFDIDPGKIIALDADRSYIEVVTHEALAGEAKAVLFRSTSDFAELSNRDVIIICVPTPPTKYRDPDLSFVVATSRAIAATLRPGQLIALESTTYPGRTNDVVTPILEATSLTSGSDFVLGFSPSGKTQAIAISKPPQP